MRGSEDPLLVCATTLFPDFNNPITSRVDRWIDSSVPSLAATAGVSIATSANPFLAAQAIWESVMGEQLPDTTKTLFVFSGISQCVTGEIVPSDVHFEHRAVSIAEEPTEKSGCRGNFPRRLSYQCALYVGYLERQRARPQRLQQ